MNESLAGELCSKLRNYSSSKDNTMNQDHGTLIARTRNTEPSARHRRCSFELSYISGSNETINLMTSLLWQ